MPKVVVTHRTHFPLSSGGTVDLLPGLRVVTEEVSTSPDLATYGIVSADRLTDEELARAADDARYWDGRIVGLTVNIPQTDVNASGAASARHHLAGDFGTDEERDARRGAFAPGTVLATTEVPPPSGGGAHEEGSQQGQGAGGGPTTRRPGPRPKPTPAEA